MTDKPAFQPEFYKVKRKPSQKQIEANRRNGAIGGRAKVPKGFAAIDPTLAREIQSKGGLTTGGNIQAYNEKRKK
jgi:general stress protein YciG